METTDEVLDDFTSVFEEAYDEIISIKCSLYWKGIPHGNHHDGVPFSIVQKAVGLPTFIIRRSLGNNYRVDYHGFAFEYPLGECVWFYAKENQTHSTLMKIIKSEIESDLLVRRLTDNWNFTGI